MEKLSEQYLFKYNFFDNYDMEDPYEDDEMASAFKVLIDPDMAYELRQEAYGNRMDEDDNEDDISMEDLFYGDDVSFHPDDSEENEYYENDEEEDDEEYDDDEDYDEDEEDWEEDDEDEYE